MCRYGTVGSLADADVYCRFTDGPAHGALVLDQAMNGDAFKEYLSSQLGPTLRPGDIVICDNLPAHKVADVQELIEARGATMKYLPPYSPDLNPIEQVFAKLKALLRKAAERTVDQLWQAIGQIMDQFHSDECLNYFNNSGYVSN
ncbi:transposase [Methylobacter sp.]|uniref:transposase n=1 Tax=Methylobacter sp. TaxID=2051955 RepID=UPI003FA592ED